MPETGFSPHHRSVYTDGPSHASENRCLLWGIAADVLRDLFKRGKYQDVILPMCVIRRLETMLEPTKAKVLATRQMLDATGITEQRAALCAAAGQEFYNTSRFTLGDLTLRGSQQQLLAALEDYLIIVDQGLELLPTLLNAS